MRREPRVYEGGEVRREGDVIYAGGRAWVIDCVDVYDSDPELEPDAVAHMSLWRGDEG